MNTGSARFGETFINLSINPHDVTFKRDGIVGEDRFLRYQPSISDPQPAPCPSELSLAPLSLVDRGNPAFQPKSMVCSYMDHIYTDTDMEPAAPLSTESKQDHLLCWWCAHHIEGNPVGYPTKMRGEKYECRGYFCSFECAMAYVRDKPCKQSIPLLGSMYRAITGNSPLSLKKAPPREALTCFGGTMSIEQFRSHFDNSNTIVRVKHHPYIDIKAQSIDEIPLSTTSNPIPSVANSNQEQTVYNTFGSVFVRSEQAQGRRPSAWYELY
ncbi:uncharacterized protein BJ171DRAFT_591342 [Polychytrium aggregatum]|uniref:uncharacterized protein n=1 Tax=Polychytrium aggregatum TaxID=110093 RepID=UPI0022FDD39E|nr:uncharacterized protein BJ171DRAFT_591342 [Polychytrium aggregatum]KAI9190672.1 hypothetical protein BJ171DRAFT_591342 [Polychytrium aggregatum]